MNVVPSTGLGTDNPTYEDMAVNTDASTGYLEVKRSLEEAKTYSNYKGHNTVKFLIAVSPTGAVMFVSKCWGGRVSDKHITTYSGWMNNLIHGDLVLADRGFDIADDLALFGATLALIPPFTKGKTQLSQKEVETSRTLSHVRIHVERAIGRVKQYKINNIKFYKEPYPLLFSRDHMKLNMLLSTKFYLFVQL